MSIEAASHQFTVDVGRQRQRLDTYLADVLGGFDLSRSRIKNLIESEAVLVNGSPVKSSYRLRDHDLIVVTVPEITPSELRPEAIDFPVIYEDDDLLVISKPPGLVVHPGCGHQDKTLVHGLLFHCDDLAGIGGEERPGIVHRLDKDTSGVLVVAKNDRSHQHLLDQFRERQVTKVYRAIVNGRPETANGRIERPVGRHPVQRRKMAINERQGRTAVTNWQVLENFAEGFAYLELELETGRTHQIRVHMAAIGHPVTGDEIYGRQDRRRLSELGVKRHCLHSYQLGFRHPHSGENLLFTAPLWPDFQAVLDLLRQRAGAT